MEYKFPTDRPSIAIAMLGRWIGKLYRLQERNVRNVRGLVQISNFISFSDKHSTKVELLENVQKYRFV